MLRKLPGKRHPKAPCRVGKLNICPARWASPEEHARGHILCVVQVDIAGPPYVLELLVYEGGYGQDQSELEEEGRQPVVQAGTGPGDAALPAPRADPK